MALVAAFMYVIKVRLLYTTESRLWFLPLSPFKQQFKLYKNLFSAWRSTPTVGGAEIVEVIKRPKTATSFNNISNDTFICLSVLLSRNPKSKGNKQDKWSKFKHSVFSSITLITSTCTWNQSHKITCQMIKHKVFVVKVKLCSEWIVEYSLHDLVTSARH